MSDFLNFFDILFFRVATEHTFYIHVAERSNLDVAVAGPRAVEFEEPHVRSVIVHREATNSLRAVRQVEVLEVNHIGAVFDSTVFSATESRRAVLVLIF